MLVSHRDGFFILPVEFYMAWHAPRYIFLEQTFENGYSLRTPAKPSIRTALGKIKRRGRILTMSHVDFSVGVFFEDKNSLLADSDYFVSNYSPRYRIFFASELDSSDSEFAQAIGEANSKSWAEQVNYHEHRSFKDQKKRAHEISKLITERISAHIDDPKTILELGCGSGRNLEYLHTRFPSAKITGIDIHEVVNGLELGANVRGIKADILNLDWNSIGKFDVIFTSGLLMHINNFAVKDLLDKINTNSFLHFHFELHGESHFWDYDRYPRSYGALAQELDLQILDYSVFHEDGVYSSALTSDFAHVFFVAKGKCR